ncbi:MAG: rhomboid family intramembrane serine protease [Solirubrobacterales bacterium]|nr:rhomboid family intramembrane serine protease [Solirubrobacterales bacterium]
MLTVLLIVINVGFFIWQWQFPTSSELDQVGLESGIDQSAVRYGAIPYRLTHPGQSRCAIGAVKQSDGGRAAEVVCEGSPELAEAEAFAERAAREGVDAGPIGLDQAAWWVTILTSMFMHGGILHLAGNMLFLGIFGNNIEDSMGRPRFLAFYLLAGTVAVYAQSLVDPGSTIPTIGASGAVAGVLGGYALLHPRARVLTLIFIIFFVTLIEIPAMVLLGIWFVLQFLPALGQTAITDLAGGDGVAYLAHVGGFIFGLLAIKLFANRRRPTPGAPLPPGPAY